MAVDVANQCSDGDKLDKSGWYLSQSITREGLTRVKIRSGQQILCIKNKDIINKLVSCQCNVSR